MKSQFTTILSIFLFFCNSHAAEEAERGKCHKEAISHLLAGGIQPKPRIAEFSNSFAKIPERFSINAPANPTPVESTAVNYLSEDLINRFELSPAQTIDNQTERGNILKISINPQNLDYNDGSDWYEIRSETRAERITEVEISGHQIGLLCGARVFIDIMRSLAANGIHEIPLNMLVKDRPANSTRAVSSGTWPNNPEDGMRMMMYSGANTWWVKCNDANINGKVNLAKKYGVSTHAVQSSLLLSGELKRPLCPSNRNDVELVASRFENAAKSGCDGLIFSFDDIQDELHAIQCDRCAKKYDGRLGRLQRELVDQMTNIGQLYGIKKFGIVPTPYYRGSLDSMRSLAVTQGKKAGIDATSLYDQYYLLLNGKSNIAITMYTCEFKHNDLAALNAGPYGFFLNGLWGSERFFSWFTGLPRLSWSWNTMIIDTQHGPLKDPSTDELYRLSPAVRDIFLGTGDSLGILAGGIWMWNPANYNEQDALGYALQKTIGTAPLDDFDRFERGMIPLSLMFDGFNTPSVDELNLVNPQKDSLRRNGPPFSNPATSAIKMKECALMAEKAAASITERANSSKNNRVNKPPLKGDHILLMLNESCRQALSKVQSQKRALAAPERQDLESCQAAIKTSIHYWKFDGENYLSAFGIIPSGCIKWDHFNGDGFLKFYNDGNFGAAKIELEKTEEYRDSFTVSCWVRPAGRDPGWYQFAGSRSTSRDVYASAGWSLGQDKNGSIRFTVDDGDGSTGNSQKSICALPLNIDWYPDEWNFIVGVKDHSKSRLFLYVNGRCVASCNDISKSCQSKTVIIGHDFMGGGIFTGDIDNIKISTTAETPVAIAAQYRVTLHKK